MGICGWKLLPRAVLVDYSPDYNPIEKLWKNTKKDATHCKYFPTFEDLRSSVIKAFEKYLQDAAKVICVMKKLRANAGVVQHFPYVTSMKLFI